MSTSNCASYRAIAVVLVLFGWVPKISQNHRGEIDNAIARPRVAQSKRLKYRQHALGERFKLCQLQVHSCCFGCVRVGA